ncbi:Fpg/Nei family DNA glycosylase [Micropruina glycogenica]|uniref:DNA-(apurinic or apyrimidinic site) lyase n=1 Tax=Micropruina glycogenica TaxID=75385 RepID=A0A2N9JJX7_9ACTN|nr:DNA-formamidopyrimidine glycosylase family protein [Micropruina glycogenica]SPD88330.1 putative endonuclease 8 2 [Micropruina glycogenica]
MPEGDTVWRTAQRLNQVFAGHILTRCDLRWPELSTLDFTGHTTTEVISRGKHLLHRLDSGWTIHSHLRMEGQWRIEPPGTRANGQTRALLATNQWTALGQRLGMLDVVRAADEYTLVGHLGPDVLGPDWNPAVAATNLGNAGDTIGAALLDQTNLAGVGTLYASDSLFMQRIHPLTPAAHLTADQRTALVERAHKLLDHNRHHALQSTTGNRRRGETTWVFARPNQPCRRCGTTVQTATVGPPTRQRGLCYCPRCQGGPT